MKKFHLSAMLSTVLLICASGASAQGAAPSTPVSKKRPNVLFIAIDDLRPELGCYGNEQMRTPNIDALASEGTLFTRVYCQMALCSPSRMSLLSGRRPDSTHIYDLETPLRKTLPNVVTLPQAFKNAGYHVQGFGKIYHGGRDDAASWSVPHTPNRAPQYGSPEILAFVKTKGAEGWEQGGKNKGPAWEAAEVEDNALCDGWIADKALAAMREIKAQGKPFFLAVGFEKPHLPFVAPKKYFEPYPLESINLPANFQAPEDCPHLALTTWPELRAYEGIPKQGQVSDQQAKELIRAYYAATSYADAQAGRLLRELETLGLKDNTIVVLWGDHGWQLGEQGLWSKHTNFENSTRTVLMFRAPGQKAPGIKSNALVELVDIYPTVCALAGIATPDGLEGRSLAPLLNGAKIAGRKAALSQYPRQGDKVMGYSIRTDRYRYTEWQENWKTPAQVKVIARELYDHETDPAETRNLANDPQQSQNIEELSALLAQARQQS